MTDQAPPSPSTPRRGTRWRQRRVFWLAGLTFLALITVQACQPATVRDDSEAPSTGTAPGTPATAEPTSTSVAEPVFLNFLSIEPLPPQEPAIGSDATVGGSPDRRAATAITQMLEDAGQDLTGMEIWVLPITGTGDSLLVMEIDESALPQQDPETQLDPLGDDQLMATLLSALETAGVSQIAVNFYGSDEQGPFVLTITFPVSALEASERFNFDQAAWQMKRR